MKRLKILYIALSCGPNLGSEDAVGWNVPLEASRAGHDVTVLTRGEKRGEIEAYISKHPGDVYPKFVYQELSRLASWCKGPFYSIRAKIWCDTVSKRLSEICTADKFDVVHQITPVEFRSIVDMSGIEALRVLGPVGGGGDIAPIFAKQYLSRSDRAIESLRGLMNSLAIKSSKVRHALMSHAVVLAANQETASVLRRMGWVKDIQIQSEVAASFKSHHPKNNAGTDEIIIGTAGRLHYGKGVSFLLDVVDCCKKTNVKLLIAGDGPQRQFIENEIKRRGLSNRVELLGLIPHDDIDKFYQRLDVFAFPSFREATGTVLVEALGAGVPCVAFDAFGAREVLKGSPECLVALCPTYEETVGSFAKAIETVSRCSVEQSLTPMDWRAQFGSFSNLYTRGLEPEEL